jgi:site-specific recombinase XerD
MKRYKPGDNKYNGIFTHTAKDGKVTWYMSGSVRGETFGPIKIPGAAMNGSKAKNRRDRYIEDLVKGDTVKGKDMRFAQAYLLWQEWAIQNLKTRTYKPMKYRYEKHLKRCLNRVRLDQMDEPFARKLVTKWQRGGQDAPTCKQNLAVVGSIYKAMRELGYWEGKSPIYGMNIKGSKHRRIMTLTANECHTLLLEFKKTRIHYYWMMALMWRGGMRPSEVLKLRPMDIHPRQGFILIPDVKNPHGEYKTRKVWFKDDRFLSTIVRQILIRIPRRSDQRFFPVTLDTKYIRSIFAKCGYNKGLKSKDMVNRYSPYTFRHSYATQALEAGANVKDVQRMLGHDSLDSTMVYVHEINDAAQRGQALLAKALDASMENPELREIKGGKI